MPQYRVHLERHIGGSDTIEWQQTTVDVEAENATDARHAASGMAAQIEWPALGPHSGVAYPIAVSAERIDAFGDAVRHAIRRPDFSRGVW